MTDAATIGPTPEQLRKGTYDTPERSREVQRDAHKRLDEFEQLFFRKGDLEFYQLETARKLRTHWEGAQGRDVRHDDGGGWKERVEYPRTMHAQILAIAERLCTRQQWAGLTILLMETGDVAYIGRSILKVRNQPQARAAGLVLIQTALDLLAVHWGKTER